MLNPVITNQHVSSFKSSAPASLSSKCLNLLAKSSRQLSSDSLTAINSSALQKLWKAIVDSQRDTLELWLMFLLLAPSEIQTITPQFICRVEIEVFRNLAKLLRDSLPESSKIRIGQSITIKRELTLNSQLMFQLAAFAELVYLDLTNCVWPLDLDEIDKTLKILIKSMQVGSLTTLNTLKLPRVGPTYLKQALKLRWPRTLEYLQSPIKPADFGCVWRPCSISSLENAQTASPLIKIVVNSHNPKKPQFTKGCMEIRRPN